jgi:hypothetical protein
LHFIWKRKRCARKTAGYVKSAFQARDEAMQSTHSDKAVIVRALVLSIFGAVALGFTVMLFATWGVQLSIFGWNLGPDGTTLIYITPDRPAAKAGIHPGDRVEWRTLSVRGRANLALVQAVAPDAKLRITVYRGSHARTVYLSAVPWESIVGNASRVATAVALVLVAVGIGLVYLRPTRMTWGFLLASTARAIPFYAMIWGQEDLWKFLAANEFGALSTGAAAAGILMFMSRFPSDRARGPLILFDRAAIPVGVAVGALGTYNVVATAFSSSPPPASMVFTVEYVLGPAIALVALGALIIAYVLSKGSDRQRVIPVLFAFAFYVACSVWINIYNALYTNALGNGINFMLVSVAMLALVAAVAHGVIRNRVLDVSFAISRTLVYTVLTSMIVGAFVLVDFVSSKLLEHFQFTVALEMVVALAFGIWLNALHARIDRFVDRVLFRRRHLAEARLERTGRALVHAESAAFIDEALVIEACDALALRSAAVFRRDGTERFIRVLSRGWAETDLHAVTSEDHLVVNLLGDLQLLDLRDVRWPHEDVPHGLAQPLIAIPLCVRHELLAFVLYGGHVGGEAIDPDEKNALTRLADAAAAAYEHVHAKAVITEATRLRTENTELQHEQRLLREMVDALRSVRGGVEG